ncbi:MAG: SPOR domain-containing protein, partial [Treponema sp.]|nr:SPOR domain-containing protein [Treponema sp.]
EPASAQRTAIEARTVREQDLQKGSYYVQIATMTRAENINELLETYSKYPVVLVPAAGGAYRVLVGPLSVDEYGVVLAKFRAFGFKDAFLRHIK